MSILKNSSIEENNFKLYIGVNLQDFSVKSNAITYEEDSDEEMFLELESKDSLSFEFEHEYEYPLQVLLSKSGNTVDLLMKGLTMGHNITTSLNNKDGNLIFSKYQDLPSYKSTSSLKVPSSLTFLFYFGQRGLYSGEEEVVKPILRLAKAFAPKEAEGMLTDLPFPDTSSMLTKLTTNVFSNNLESLSYDEDNKDGLFGMASSLISKVDYSVKDTFSDPKANTFCRANFGGIWTPAFFVNSVSFNFDFKEMDDLGFPVAGTLSLEGIETIEVATKDALDRLKKV